MLIRIMTLIVLLIFNTSWAEPIHIIAAENFYGDIAAKLGGNYVSVDSILNNPKQDPHLFSINPAIAKAITHADIIIYNGLDYDSWMENLITANSQKKLVIVVADLMKKKSGDNPHIWYDPNTMLVYATYLVKQLSLLDVQHKDYFQQQLTLFKQQYQLLINKVIIDKTKWLHTPVIATEPVFNDMANTLGLTMYGLHFQLSVMNDTEPSAADIKDFQNKLMTRSVKVLIINNQVSDPLTQRMEEIAQKANIPIVGVSETEPPMQDYFTWMRDQLINLEKALGESGERN